MEKLDIKKVYIDTRFKTADSKGDADFTVQLPKSFNIPDDTVCYVDDVSIPVSWPTIGDRNNKFYFSVNFDDFTYWFDVTLDTKNYNGQSFVTELENKMNDAVALIYHITFQLTYDTLDNKLTISFTDLRTVRATRMTVTLYGDTELMAGQFHTSAVSAPRSINDNIRLTSNYVMVEAFSYENHPVNPFSTHLNMHAIRNLYMLSSALSNYDTVSNFSLDTIVKKIPVKANYNEIIFDNASEGFDYITLSRRSLDRIDFKLVDSHGSTIDLRNNHFSFSLVFQRQN